MVEGLIAQIELEVSNGAMRDMDYVNNATSLYSRSPQIIDQRAERDARKL